MVTTMGKFVCSLIRDAINSDPSRHDVNLCLVRGGHICGEKDYPADSFFSLEDLRTVNTDEVVVGVVDMPGELIVRGIKSTRGSISRLFLQYDDGVKEKAESLEVTHVDGAVLDPEAIYRVATTWTTIKDVAVFSEYYGLHGMPREEEFVPLEVELMSYFARKVWKRILKLCASADGVDVTVIDTDGDGFISKAEIQDCMKRLGVHVADGEFTLVDFIVSVVDANQDGMVSAEEFKNSAR
eukprot:gnl/TRDRNA2_/TRDRNA2_165808_c1_seq1.p1 gnl/TRDRNA2_/TRDRNA2_165808_c1~~gnl/TRDRNA2_/TRDRNA2_165808_c1_seq1.p1  ORF type:complete len:240 (-),score=37.13 gnl/TRDRNA2_/TRDRNA2_165808_c1_seq1:301-1020(-)